MSVEVVLVADPMPGVAALREWFAARPFWQQPDAAVDEVRYEHPRTGAYFDLDFAEPAADDPDEEPGVVATLPTFKPLPFLAAIVAELEAFLAAFPSLRFEEDADLHAVQARWIAANEAAVAGMASIAGAGYGGSDRLALMPSDRLAAIWEWNARGVEEARRSRGGSAIAVPPAIRFANVDGDLLTVAVLPDDLDADARARAVEPIQPLLDVVAIVPAVSATDDRATFRGATAWLPIGEMAAAMVAFPLPSPEPALIHPADVLPQEWFGE